MAKVIYEKRDQIAYITLNRPEVHNAIDTETDELLFEAWTDFRDDPDVRIAILTGSGDKTFCSTRDSGAGSPEGCTGHPNRSSRRSTAGSSEAASNLPWPATSGSRPSTRTSGSFI
jgi:enoyl-CoA hydratase/carnithine racemase